MKNYEKKFSENFKNIPPSFIREILSVADQGSIISFAGGLPNPDFFPVKQLAESACQVLSKNGKTVLQYAGSKGYSALCEWIAERYSKKYNLKISPYNIVITGGSQQTLDIISKIFLNKGDSVIVEKPTYLGAIQAISSYLPNFKAIDLYEDGPDTEQIKYHCKNSNPKFMYSIPNFQNPSGICYNFEKRVIVSEIIKEFGLYLLEDDPYNEIRFSDKDLPPIYSFASENVFWTGSFSKMVAPGLRMGWVVLPNGLAPHFIRAKQSTDLHSNNLSQYILHHFLTNNDIDEHLSKIKIAYKNQCESMKNMIKKYLPEEVKITHPCGGMFIWLTLPYGLDSGDLITECMKRGVAFVPGKSFFTDGSGENHIRMNFSNQSEENIQKGIKIMGEELQKMMSNKKN